MPDPHITDCTVVVMAKAPRSGAVKTRLAQRFSSEEVRDLYRCLLEDTLALARSLQDVQVAVMCPADDVQDLSGLFGPEVCVVAQTGDGLSAGLTSVFAQFAGDRHRRVIAFNSDSPHLPPSVLEKAFDALAVSDLVVGPTNDGGYYLVGSKGSQAGLFAGDGMGTTSALTRLLARARDLRLSVHLMDPFYDIDVAADLSRLADELRVAPERAPKTAKWLSDRASGLRGSLLSHEHDSSDSPDVHSAT